ncbi:MAG: sensor histidine kinase [Myxococcaceae bacterium]
MEPPSSSPTPEREDTDLSLREEREKTDLELTRKRDEFGEDSDAIVRRARELADQVLAAAERRSDSTRAVTPRLVQERLDEKERLHGAREVADERVAADRELRALALAEILRLERASTDEHLVIERRRSDDATSTRDEFLAMVSHDLRSMLGGLALNAALVVKGVSSGSGNNSVVLAAARIQRVVGRMDRLVGDLIDIASLEAGKLRLACSRVDVTALAQDSVQSFQAVAGDRGLTLRLEAPPESVPAEVDSERILQVLANLLGNAIKFTPVGGAIVVRVEPFADRVELTVTDNGPGIAAEDQPSVFVRFWQADRGERRGMGLGLYIARSIAEAHGGGLTLESELGRGSTFRLSVPRRASA